MRVLKKLMAILAVLVMVALYVAVVLCAIYINKVGNKVFLAVFVAALLVPLLIYLVFWLCNLFRPEQSLEEASREAKKKGFQEAAAFSRSKQVDSFTSETHDSKQASGESRYENEEEDDEA